jgi:Recombinase
MRSADAREQLAVNLGNEAKRERQVAQPREAVVHRVDIADHLVDVLRQVAPRRPRLELDCEQVFERALRALDLRAEDGLPAERTYEPKLIWAPPHELREVVEVERFAYSRKQAAEALGVSISTIDRRVVPSVRTVKTPWGQRLIPVAELDRFLCEHLEPARERGERGTAGRPPTLPQRVVERIRLAYARGHGLADIARELNDDGVPTAHGGRQWWPSTVRAVLVRSATA